MIPTETGERKTALRRHYAAVRAGLPPRERAAAEQYAAGLLLADLSPAWRERFERLRDALRAACAEALQIQPLIKVKEAAHA